jgi:hypothetical protein
MHTLTYIDIYKPIHLYCIVDDVDDHRIFTLQCIIQFVC